MENFMITIARQYGSGGKEIGKRLAERLSVPYYGKKELMELAKGKPDYEEVRSFYEEQPVDSLLYAIAMNQAEAQVGRIPFRRIQELCKGKSCVLIGRCGNYIFREDQNCVRIFVYAGTEKKICWVMEHEGISRNKALRKIRQTEEERAQFHKYYTGESWGNVNHYDICLDAGVLGINKTVDVILAYLESRGMRKNE